MKATVFVACLALSSPWLAAGAQELAGLPGGDAELRPGGQPDFSEQTSNMIVTNALPGLRFQQTTAGGLPAQAWDFRDDASTIFRLVDRTSGGRPLKIDPSTPSFSFVIRGGNGNVGLRASTPLAPLHLRRTDGSTYVLMQDTSNVPMVRSFLTLQNRGASTVRFDDTSAGGLTWAFGTLASGNFFVTNTGLALTVTPQGNATIAGTLSQLSDRDAKQDVESLDRAALLARVAALPLATWSYKDDPARHVGPMAQDFMAAFGLGTDDTRVSLGDLAGVGLAGVQALADELGGLERRLAELQKRLADRDAGLDDARARLESLRALARRGRQ